MALGANLSSWAGRPDETLRAALGMIAGRGIALCAVSRFWRSAAWPQGSGPDYVNAAAALACDMPPEAMLGVLHDVEAALGRVREDARRWGPRGIDLDLIAVDGAVRPNGPVQDRWRALPSDMQARQAPDGLILPHPRMQDRGFVLAPLAEIAPRWVHPRTGLDTRQMLGRLPPEALAGLVPGVAAPCPP